MITNKEIKKFRSLKEKIRALQEEEKELRKMIKSDLEKRGDFNTKEYKVKLQLVEVPRAEPKRLLELMPIEAYQGAVRIDKDERIKIIKKAA